MPTSPDPETPPDARRSRFVTVVAWLTIVASVIVLLPLPLVLPALTVVAPTEADQLRNGVLILGAVCIVQIVMGFGLLNRRNWAWLLMLLSLTGVAIWQAIALMMVEDSIAILDTLGNDPVVAELRILIPRIILATRLTIIAGSLWALYLFMRRDVRREFGAAW